MTRVGVVGAAGRMGETVCRLVASAADMRLVAAVERADHPGIGIVLHGCALTPGFADALRVSDAVVDFALADGLEERAAACARSGRVYICGVTGLPDAAMDALREAGRRIAAVYAPNFSLGVNVLYQLASQTARTLGAGYDVEIVEAHHRGKRDAPSGTAVRLAETVRTARAGDVPVHSIRAGDITGDHTIVFAGPGERLELTHRASSREAFASGILLAVRFARKAGPGLYSMADVLAD